MAEGRASAVGEGRVLVATGEGRWWSEAGQFVPVCHAAPSENELSTAGLKSPQLLKKNDGKYFYL